MKIKQTQALDVARIMEHYPKNETPIKGIAYFRLNKAMKEFLEQCYKKENVIGFEYDSEDPWNFGVVLGKDFDK